MAILTVIDTTGTQSYIFGSNRLRESIGASEIVARATTRWVFDVIKSFENENGWMHNLKSSEEMNPFDEIDENEIENLQAEVIYCGGGNGFILFDTFDNAKEFSKKYTGKLLKDAPNFQVVIAHSDCDGFSLDENKLTIIGILDSLMKKLNRKKANRDISTPLLGLAVSAQCVSSGGVAVAQPIPRLIDIRENLPEEAIIALEDKYKHNYLSAETLAKLAFAEKATKRLKGEVFNNQIALEIPRELDDLGRTHDEASYVAFVHTDGNGMGERIKLFGNKLQNDREWIKGIRLFSSKIYTANKNALQETVKYLNDHLKKIDDNWFFVSADSEMFKLSPKKNKKGEITNYYFPLRPIIFGGEDIAFVCDGRIALNLTSFYLTKLREQELDDQVNYLYARAGIAIVKSHFPFRRAYDLSEQLAKSAKERINAIDQAEKKVAAMDWQVVASGLLGNLNEIREREYISAGLNMRPLSIDERESDDDWQTWKDFEKVIRAFQGTLSDEKTNWREKRNKVKALREALRNGKDAVEKFRGNYRLDLLPSLTIANKAIQEKGWDESKQRCSYFDAIEMLDLFYRMEETTEAK